MLSPIAQYSSCIPLLGHKGAPHYPKDCLAMHAWKGWFLHCCSQRSACHHSIPITISIGDQETIWDLTYRLQLTSHAMLHLTLWFLCFDGSHISIGDLDSGDPRLLKPRLVALIIWLVGIECKTKVRPETHLGG